MMQKKKRLRKRLFVDPKVQGTLALRVVFYWIACMVTVTLMLLCWRIVTGPSRMFYTHFDEMWYHFGPALVASTLLLPLVIVDMIRLSNRFTGPMLRLRRSMRALSQGKDINSIEFRDGDFWQEFAEEFNAVATRVQALSSPDESTSQPAADRSQSEDPEAAVVGTAQMT